MTLKDIISMPLAYEVTRVSQGYGNLRVDAINRRTKERYSKWVSIKYFNFLCKDWGRNISIDH